MKKLNINTVKKVVPMCYAYTTPQIKEHDGWTKIGFTERDVITRIEEQTRTADIAYVLEWKANAVFDDGSGDIFSDKDFHAYLRKLGITQKNNTEWFYVAPEESRRHFDDFRAHRGVVRDLGVIPYKLRDEQADAVQQTAEYFSANKDFEPKCLWNAKPRFGKTLATYDLCKTVKAPKVLIVTNRPAIANSWYDDYVKFLGTESGYYFISPVDALKGKPLVIAREQLPGSASGYIEFVSLQDLKGSVYFGGQYDKLKEIAELEWDILVIDEAHEGVDTYKTDVAFDHIKRKYTLHLSGTPFKALAKGEFAGSLVYNWTYADEQQKKRDWDNSSEEENPYAGLPKLNLYTYLMSDIVRDKVAKGADFNDDGDNENYAFDLNEFFETKSNGEFKHDAEVDRFLDALTTQSKFPFSTPELREELKHTFWLFNRVDSAKAMAKKLQNHPVFGNHKYEIVLAAGDGKLDEDSENKKALDKVRKAISEYDKTITLSVGQLTTGITVPEWTAVLMLSNVKSPALYMQAAFRAQNLCLFNRGGQLFRKENAYVFDFDPARTLDIFERFANDLSNDTSGGKGDSDIRKQHIRELLNFFPVYGEDSNGEMIELDAEKVLSIPRRIHAQEVVRRGFMSNFLFQNISCIFGAPQEAVNIIKKFEPVKEKEALAITDATKDELSLNGNGEVEVSPAFVIGQEQKIFGDKIYEITDDLQEQIDKLTTKDNRDPELERLKESFHISVTDKLVSSAKENYGSELSKSAMNDIVRKLNTTSDSEIVKRYVDYRIKQNTLETERAKQLENEYKPERIAQINRTFDAQKMENKQQFAEDMKTVAQTVVQESAKTIVQTVETDKKQKEKNAVEDTIRDHLRGFARTIPSFLMAYGDESTTLENFDTIIPDKVFKEVTSITLDEFRFLRDGGDYSDEETGETKHFAGRLFEPVVFNDSVKEFLNLKKKLADYFDENAEEDIFDYIPPQKTNQIYTPKKVVREMVDMLELENPHCFDDENKTFIDLYMKSGLYIAEIVKRLYKSEKLKQLYPNGAERLKHIFSKQVYGLAPTEIIYRIAAAFVLGFNEEIKIEKHNLRLFDTLPSVQKGTLETDLDKVFE